MLEILKEIILDFQEMELFTGVPRRVELSALPGKATVCIGVRRAGKSTLMFQLIDRLEREGVPLLENLIFVELRRRGKEVYYYRTKSGKEVDFLALSREGRELIQVSATLRDRKTKERELSALREAMKELGLARASVVTLNERETIQTDEGTVEIIPVWEFLLKD